MKSKQMQFPSQVNWIPLATVLIIAISVWFLIPPPQGLSLPAWQTLIIFVSCIASIVLNVLPIGAIGIIAITVYAVSPATGADSVGDAMKIAMSELNSTLIWLIVCAFIIARGFSKTGFGKRIAYIMIRMFGKRSIGLAYGLSFADLILAPAMPSNTARCGGIIYPIANSLAQAYDSYPNDPSKKRLGSYLITSIGNVNDITSATFLTAFTGNLLAVSLAKQMGVDITWTSWFIAAIAPCAVAFILVPLLVYFVNPPEIKHTPEAPDMAKKELADMGPMNYGEWMMLITVALLLILWVFGSTLGIHSTAAALIGLCFLILTSVITWDDVKSEKGAWDTLIWFAALLMLATQLKTLGFTDWFGLTIADQLAPSVQGIHWIFILLILNAIYLYTHYFFASGNAQIAALFTVFVGVAASLGVPLIIAVFMLAFTSNLYCSLTQYTHARGPILFGSGYVTTSTWWRTGFVVTLLTQAIFFSVGLLWWKVIGLY